jgi:ABC-2 type transport system permease protein
MSATALPLATAPPRHSRLVGRLRDVGVLTVRNFVHIRREPLRLSDVTIQPILFTLLFVYVFGAGVSLPGGQSYADFAIAGLLALNLPTGAIVAVVGLIVGWAPGGSALATLAGFGVFLLFSYALSWVLACLGIVSKDSESAQGIGLIVLFPLAFVSNALVPTQHMPALLRTIANWNPVSAVTAAARQLFQNPNPSASIHAWPMQHPVTASLLWSVVLLAVFAPLAAWLYRRRTTE